MESTLLLLGLKLKDSQPHMSGERFLMMKDKKVLIATDKDGKDVVIKIANKQGGKNEIEHEKRTRDLLSSIVFSRGNIVFPKEILFENRDGNLVWVTEFIPQEKIFVAHTLEEQFFLILKAFEEQESFHATTFEHLKSINKFFPVYYARDYFNDFKNFRNNIHNLKNETLNNAMKEAENFLLEHKRTIDGHCNYLTHTDFVPHNFRIQEKKVYMLDLSAIHFGNKYEGWARFLNYMVIHNPELEKLLLNYIRKNRSKEEYLNLRLMRVYKIGFLLNFYAQSIEKTEGDLKKLTLKRIEFWHNVLEHILRDEVIPDKLIESYKEQRDRLRSKEEKGRQREFAVA